MSKNLALAQSLGADFKVRADVISATINDTVEGSQWQNFADGQNLVKALDYSYVGHHVTGRGGTGPNTIAEFSIVYDNNVGSGYLYQNGMDTTNWPDFHAHNFGMAGGHLTDLYQNGYGGAGHPQLSSTMPYTQEIADSVQDHASLVSGGDSGSGNGQVNGGYYIVVSPTELPQNMGVYQIDNEWPEDAYLMKMYFSSFSTSKAPNAGTPYQRAQVHHVMGPTVDLANGNHYLYVVQANTSATPAWKNSTPSGGTVDSMATQVYLDTAINDLKGSAPASMDTLKELSDAVIASPVSSWNSYKTMANLSATAYSFHVGDGATTTYTFPHRPGMIDVWVNGILQTPRISSVDNLSATPMEVLGSGYDYSSQAQEAISPALTFDNLDRELPQGVSSYYARFWGSGPPFINVPGLMDSFTALNWDGNDASPSENAGPGFNFTFPESEDSKITFVEQSSNIVMYGYLRGVKPSNLYYAEYGDIYLTPGNGDTYGDWDYIFYDAPFRMTGQNLQVTIDAYAGWTTGGTVATDVNDDQVHGTATQITFVNPPENGASIEIRFW